MKALSIIGVVLFGLGILAIVGFINSDPESAAGWGFILGCYGLAISIVSLVKESKK